MTPSDEFQRLAKAIALRDKPVFDALLEFEKTGRLQTKQRLNFTIDKKVAADFRKHCKKLGYNMSAKVEESMRKVMETNDSYKK
ncbi:hypothetical protein COY28_06270 [Candidatus Woesearchaeota archaeon CG_4_10_14_0_2_um_filter_57_5]|nr:MAG: hypothetical protein AUJ68_00875 [Candidatus Woesearchaeota archaeon CG1_02_57_44]PIZ49466.1 MAG: hypothetical protein COY28_06270 [Candidatus Woesearchaeota archaeon CG_4_10_14_0_2_um_filter_57_5]